MAMTLLSFLVALLLVQCTAAYPELFNNLAYRSPSLRFPTDSVLAHDVGALARRHTKRDGSTARYEGGLSFPYGIASGDPLADSAILWTHPVVAGGNTTLPVCLQYQTAKDDKIAQVVDTGLACTTSDVDYSLKVETKHLKPKTRYYYRFSTVGKNSTSSPIGTFKTMPRPDDATVDKLTLAVFSCSNLPYGFFNAYRKASARTNEVDYFTHVGDWIYEGKAVKGALEERQFEPRIEIAHLDEYRQRHAAYRGKDENLRAMLQNYAALTVWDDHEVADNTYKDGSADSNNTKAGYVNGIPFSERKKNAVKAYYEWMPIRQVDTTDKLRIYRQFQYGKLADINMADTRQEDRDITDIYYNTAYVKSISNDSSRHMMSNKQRDWLSQKITSSSATWKVLAQQVIFNNPLTPGSNGTFDENYDAWSGYKATQRHFMQTISKVNNTIILSGDSHAAWAFDTVPVETMSAYDPKTGAGSIAVEFAGTAVSSTSSYGKNLTTSQYNARAQQLVRKNANLQFAEGQKRGYFVLTLQPHEARADYWGVVDNNDRNSDEVLVATMTVEKDQNRLKRPLNGGNNSTGGAIQGLEGYTG